MPKLFVFAIGGTGERVMRSFTMLMAAGVPTFDNYEVFPILIDYDQKNADKIRTSELLQNYAGVHNAAFIKQPVGINQNGQANMFFASKMRNLQGLENYVFPFKPATSNEKFFEHIGYDSLAGNTLPTADLLSSLYDESKRPDTELNLDMTVGFKGNPNIGSVVFHTINNTPEFDKFKSVYNPGAGDKVIVIGSLFGGTGASGIPEIVKAVKATSNNAKIAALLVLPYFRPAVQKDAAIKAERFNSKTKAALSFYADSGIMNQIDKIYYVGDPYGTVVQYSEGGETQKNNANMVELIASMMIEHYISGRANANAKEFKFAMDANIVVQESQKSGERLYIPDFDETSIEMVMNHLIELALGLKTFHDEILSKKTKDRDFYKYLALDPVLDSVLGKTEDGDEENRMRKLCAGLEKFYHNYQEWLKELDFEGNENGTVPANSHRLALCDMTQAYSDIILCEPITSDNIEKKSKWDKWWNIMNSKGKKSAVDSDNIHAYLETAYTGHYNPTKADTETDRTKEWVLSGILHYAAQEAFKKITGAQTND